jgi:hypothetical protein
MWRWIDRHLGLALVGHTLLVGALLAAAAAVGWE